MLRDGLTWKGDSYVHCLGKRWTRIHRLYMPVTRDFVSGMLLLALLALPLVSLPGQSSSSPRLQARVLPVAAGEGFTLIDPPVAGGSRGSGSYPKAVEFSVPAVVVHGAKPGPVIAYVFRGFSSPDAFAAEMDLIFGKLNPAQMQGTVLALHLPARDSCEPSCPDEKDRLWQKLAPSIWSDARFVIDLHLHADRPELSPHAFLYKPAGNPRLATYVESLAKAGLIRRLVNADVEASVEANLEHLAPGSNAEAHPAISVEVGTLEGNTSAEAAQLRKGMVNILHHLKMAPGAVGWQGSVQRVPLQRALALLGEA
jgi:hypothetical protein